MAFEGPTPSTFPMTFPELSTRQIEWLWRRFDNLGNIFLIKKFDSSKWFRLPVRASCPPAENLIETPSFHGMKRLWSTNFCNYEQYKFAYFCSIIFFHPRAVTKVQWDPVIQSPFLLYGHLIDSFCILPK